VSRLIGLALAAVIAAGFAGCAIGTTRHDAGDGPLSTNAGGRGDQTLALDPVNAGKTYAVTVRLCVAAGDEVVIDDVRPDHTIGTPGDWEFLGARVRYVLEGDEEAFLGMEGFPPVGIAGDIVQVSGARVATRCDAPESTERAEAVLGFRTSPSSQGGGWDSVAVSYSQKDRHYTLVVHDTWVLCGPATKVVPECESYLAR
jgi:hypothetical protein